MRVVPSTGQARYNIKTSEIIQKQSIKCMGIWSLIKYMSVIKPPLLYFAALESQFKGFDIREMVIDILAGFTSAAWTANPFIATDFTHVLLLCVLCCPIFSVLCNLLAIHCLSFLLDHCIFLTFDLRPLIIPLVSSNCYYTTVAITCTI